MLDFRFFQKYKKSLCIGLGALAVLILLIGILMNRDYSTLISAQRFEDFLQSNHSVREVWVDEDYLYFIWNKKIHKVWLRSISTQSLKGVKIIQKDRDGDFAWVWVVVVLSVAFGVWLYNRKRKKNQLLLAQESKSQDEVISPMKVQVSFKDVAGAELVKEELEDIIDFLKNPQKYFSKDIKVPKGVLLIGPPGVGKTLIAKAVASESGVPFYYQSGAGFVQIYAGMGAKRVRELFAAARKNAPCIILIDEIDAVGKARGGLRSDERESTLNELLTQLDGNQDKSQVIVIGATNHADMLDLALLRSGRFDRKVYLELPTLQDRIKILELNFKNKKYSFDLEEVARSCVGFSGAALQTLSNEAALHALKHQKERVELEDIIAVRQKVFLGKKIQLDFTEPERRILGIYQASKVFVALHLGLKFDGAGMLGEILLIQDRSILSQKDLEDRICFYLAGTAGFDVLCKERYAYGEADLKAAQELAAKVCGYGMGESQQGVLDSAFLHCKDLIASHQKKILDLSELFLQKERLEYQQILEWI